MNKKVIIGIICVVLIWFLIILVLIGRSGKQLVGSGDVHVINKWDDEYVPEIPENYIEIDKNNITNETGVVAESVAYDYDETTNTTHVNVYLQNRGDMPLNHNDVCVIELYDKDDNFLYRFGGVIESNVDINPGERTVIKTQFLDKPKDIAYAKINFETSKEVNTEQENNSESKIEQSGEVL